MDYGRVLGRAGEITWRYKWLWLLGFLVALANGGVNASSYRFPFGSFPNLNAQQFQPPPNVGGLLVGLGCLALIFVIVVGILSLIARGGLIAGVAQAEDTETFSLGSAWQAGSARFWTLLGIWFLTSFLPAVLIIGITIIGVVAIAGTAGIAVFQQNPNPGAFAGGTIALLVACCCTSICGLLIIAIILQQIRIYGERAAMLEGRGAVAACERGWQVLRDRLGPTIVLWLIFLVIGLVLGAIVLVVVLIVAVPFGIASYAGRGSNLLALSAIGIGLIGAVIGAIIGSVVEAFTSATWTLAYRELTGPVPAGVMPAGPMTPGPGTSSPPPPAPLAATPAAAGVAAAGIPPAETPSTEVPLAEQAPGEAPPAEAPGSERPPADMPPAEAPPAETPSPDVPPEPPPAAPPEDLPPEEPPQA
jgi:hypothetical protein